MKKTLKKLELNIATVRILKQDLTQEQLQQVNGGQEDPSKHCTGGSKVGAFC